MGSNYGRTHRNYEDIIQEKADDLAIEQYGGRGFDDLTEPEKMKCWEQASEDYHGSQIDAAIDQRNWR